MKKNRTVLFVVAANLLAVLLLAIFTPHLMISPGKPIDAHAELTTDCFACHTPFIGSPPVKCIECHAVEEIGLKTTTGISIAREKKNVAFHQKLIEEDCVACHSDHKGVQAFRPISQFSHQLLEPTLQEKCNNCHKAPRDEMHQKSESNCSGCHSQDAWTPATLDHDEYFRFDREHDTKCETCHIDNDYASYTCYGCHEHSRSEIREEHFEEGIREYESCVECHRSGDEDEAKRIWRSKDFDARRWKPLETDRFREREDKHHDDD